ncbi:ATP-grasp domain-containing protein [Salibacterium aidingense]|uniref:ATP-grasp domain-containing protein n=1 Tax=Salibacterium aidingense TaxID=384933 RepID=UPI003BC86A44
MESIHVLVTGIGGPTAQGILHGLKNKENVYIVGADRRRVTSGNQFCDAVYQIPRYSETEHYKQAIRDIVQKENIDAVFPSLHEEINIYNDFRHRLQVEVALPKSRIFEVLMDKESIYQYLAETGFSAYIPKYHGFNHCEELRRIRRDHFSDHSCIVTKQVNSHGALGFFILTDRETFLNAVKEGKRNILSMEDYCDIPSTERRLAMEYLEGMEYSVDVFIHEGRIVTALPRERTGVSNGIVLDGTVVYNKELIEAASGITKALVSHGFINIQFIKTEEGYKLTDVNPRFCGSQVMSLGSNVNFPYLFLQYYVLGEEADVRPKWNARMIRYRENLFVENDE